jgi:hypothetical protein
MPEAIDGPWPQADAVAHTMAKRGPMNWPIELAFALAPQSSC